MNGAALVDLLATIGATALLGVVAYLLKGRFDGQADTLAKVCRDVEAMGRDLVRLTEAQKAVVANQIAQSRSVERLIDDADDLADKASQLDGLTGRLYDKLNRHTIYLRTLGASDADLS